MILRTRLFVMLLCGLLAGCAGGHYYTQKDLPIHQFVADLQDAYNVENLQGVAVLLDQQFPDSGAFKNGMLDFFFDHKEIELTMVIDSVLEDKEEYLVKYHWYKKFRTKDGEFRKTDGAGQLIVKESHDGCRLYRIRNEHPFF